MQLSSIRKIQTRQSNRVTQMFEYWFIFREMNHFYYSLHDHDSVYPDFGDLLRH